MLQISFLTLSFISALLVILSQNPVVSVFNLILLYIIVALYLMYLGITYIGISYIIIYIGAIAILFLFIIMMIDVEITYKKYGNYIPLLVISFITLIISIVSTISIGYARNYIYFTFNWDSAVVKLTQISILGDFLYSNYHAFIYIISIILLLAMIGAIILTKTENNTKITFIRFSFIYILPSEFSVYFTLIFAIIFIFYFIFFKKSFQLKFNIKLPKSFKDYTTVLAVKPNPLTSIYDDPEKEYFRLLKEQTNIKEKIADLRLSIDQADYLMWQKSIQRTKIPWREARYEELTDDICHLVYGREVLYLAIDNMEKRQLATQWYIEKAYERIFSAAEIKWSPKPRTESLPEITNKGKEPEGTQSGSGLRSRSGSVSVSESESGLRSRSGSGSVLDSVLGLRSRSGSLSGLESRPGSGSSNVNKCDSSSQNISNNNDINEYSLDHGENNMIMIECEELPIVFNLLDNIKEDFDVLSNNLITILNNFNYFDLSTILTWTNSILMPRAPILEGAGIGFSLLICYVSVLFVRLLMAYFMYKNIKNYHMLPSMFVRIINKWWGNVNSKNGKMMIFILPIDTPWTNFEIYFYVIFILAIILWGVNLIFSLRILDMDKGRGFECGLQSFFQTREQFHISFHRVSLLFLAFDLEIVIIYPAGASNIHPPLFYNLLIFILILMVGFIYEISVNALDIFITDLVNNWNTTDFA